MHQILTRCLFLIGLLLGPAPLVAQDFNPDAKPNLDIHPTDVIQWTPVQALSDGKGVVLAGVRLETREQFSIYKDKLEFRAPAGYSLSIKTAPASRRQQDPLEDKETDVYDGGDFELELKGDQAPSGTLSIFVTFLGCTTKICLFPYTQELKLPVYLSDSSSMAADPKLGAESTPADSDSAETEEEAPITQADLSTTSAAPVAEASGGITAIERQYAERLQDGSLSFGVILLVIFVGGLATNLTPCVFPMIPITLRLLAREGQKPVEGALLYALGIILTYTGLGAVAALSGGMFGSLLANPWVNAAFGVIFLILAVTMLGFGNFARLQNAGAALGSGKASALNAVGMGAGAGLVAAPCTGPIMAALIAYSTGLSPAQSIALFFLYSLGFALPYVGLGLAAKRVKSFKLSPRIQVAIKLLFASAMFGLAAYYLKNIAHQDLLALTGYWKVIAIAFVVAGLSGVAMVLANGTLMHSKASQLLPTFLLGIGLFAGVQVATGSDLVPELPWIKSEAEGYALANQSGKPVLIDGWADWCVACKQMDQTTYRDPELINLLKDDWVLVKLDMTEFSEANEALAQKYGMPGLPTTVLVPADGDLSQAKRLTGFVTADRLKAELAAFQGK